ncbi:MAG TPA: hypothetical protein VGJ07_29870, partial [Rugosimonospora sp.]
MNAIMERWMRTCRRELLDRTLIWNQRHLLHALPASRSAGSSRRQTRAERTGPTGESLSRSVLGCQVCRLAEQGVAARGQRGELPVRRH